MNRTTNKSAPVSRQGNAGGEAVQGIYPDDVSPWMSVFRRNGLTILTEPRLHFSRRSYSPLPFESATAQLVRVFDERATKVRTALRDVWDDAWTEPWTLSSQEKKIFDGTRFLTYRQMFLNHIVHHRAQFGVYLRLNDTPVPATYGPLADDTLGY